MINRMTKNRHLRDKGYVFVSGWVPAAYAAKVAAQIDMHREDVLRVAAEKPAGKQIAKNPA